MNVHPADLNKLPSNARFHRLSGDPKHRNHDFPWKGMFAFPAPFRLREIWKKSARSVTISGRFQSHRLAKLHKTRNSNESIEKGKLS